MATNFQNTSFYHPDHVIQREFERKGKDLQSLENKITSISNRLDARPISPVAPTTIIQLAPTSATGIIDINITTKDPATRPPGDSAYNDYLYYPWEYRPENGYYGWYVYNLIHHNLQLNTENEYLIELIDLHKTNLDDDADAENYVCHYGLNANTIIVWHVYKPSIGLYYQGVMPVQYYEWEDQPNGILKTNLRFRWVVQKPIKQINGDWI